MAGPKSRDDIDRVLSEGIDTKERRIYFGNLSDKDDSNGFTWDTVEAAIRKLHALADNSQKPIELHMSSTGGATSDMLRLYDAIQECRCQIKFYGSGDICSSAAYIMAGCDERYLSKNTSIMLHETQYSGDASASHTESEIDHDESRKLRTKLVSILADNSRMDEEWWNIMLTRDIYFTPEEAIAIGIADKIIEYKKRGNLRRMRIAHLNKKVDEEQFTDMLEEMNRRIRLPGEIKVTLSIPKERHDRDVVVDNDPVTDEEAGIIEEEDTSRQHSEEQESQENETDQR